MITFRGFGQFNFLTVDELVEFLFDCYNDATAHAFNGSGEFLGITDEDDVILFAHKPFIRSWMNDVSNTGVPAMVMVAGFDKWAKYVTDN